MKARLFFFALIVSLVVRIPVSAQVGSLPLYEDLRRFGEAYVIVPMSYPGLPAELAGFTSVVALRNDSILLNVSEIELEKLEKNGIACTHVPMQRGADTDYMAVSGRQLGNWNVYPTWPQYDSIMYGFASQYPALCQTSNFLTLNSGRKLLISKLTSTSAPPFGKPKVLYSATIHGDETAGFILMLRLMDHLLQGYGNDAEATWLLDNLEIWICPLANPDGTYHGGNHTVVGATRRNANLVDLNRNYPDPRVGANPDGNPYQPETVAFMGLADTVPFVLGANMHSGAEVVNYPWDTWTKTHPDDLWWHRIARRYADTVHANSFPFFFMDLDSGVTNGAAWYVITGGRQDYMNYFASCRELTLELSSNFIEPVSNLDNMWIYHHRSLINYLKESWYGLRGTVTDSLTGQPLKAKVWITQHDADSSHVYSLATSGDYFRPLYPGSYHVTWSAPGYVPKSNNVVVSLDDTLVVNVSLVPVGYQVSLPDQSQVQSFWYDQDERMLRFLLPPVQDGIVLVYSAEGKKHQQIKNPGLQQPLLLHPGLWFLVYHHPDGTRITRKVIVP